MRAMQIKRQVKYEQELDRSFGRRIAASPGAEELYRCFQCGACSSACPLSLYMDHTPRRIMALARAGFKQEVLSSNTIWLCTSCYACTVNCPKKIKITDVMYVLKQQALKEGYYPKRFATPVLAREFFKSVQRTGRSNEGRIVTRMWLKTRPWQLLRQAGLGLKLLRRGRLMMRQDAMNQGLDQLQRALNGVRKSSSTATGVSQPPSHSGDVT